MKSPGELTGCKLIRPIMFVTQTNYRRVAAVNPHEWRIFFFMPGGGQDDARIRPVFLGSLAW
ncbi:hypothetical protein ACFL6S_09035 [Candidatus Poribacteria bacterium]